MKKTVAVLLTIVLLLALSGCGLWTAAAPQAAPNTISAIQLTDREKLLVSALCGRIDVFEYHVDSKDYSWVNVWVEAYRFGKKTDNAFPILKQATEPDGTILLFTNKADSSETQKRFNIVIHSGGSQSEVSDAIWGFGDEENLPVSSKAVNDDKPFPVYGKPVIACFQYAEEGRAVFTLPDYFFVHFEKNMDLLNDANIAYVVRCEFLKEQPK
jgi:hypothetical protein